MPRLVHHLGGGVVLGVDPRHRFHDLGGTQQSALLAVQELRKRPVLRFATELDPFVRRPLLERRALQIIDARHEAAVSQHVAERHLLLVDFGIPGHVGFGVPLARLGLLVQPAQLRPRALRVVPGKDRVEVLANGVDRLRDIAVGHGENRLQVVHLYTTYQVRVLGRRSVTGHLSPLEAVAARSNQVSVSGARARRVDAIHTPKAYRTPRAATATRKVTGADPGPRACCIAPEWLLGAPQMEGENRRVPGLLARNERSRWNAGCGSAATPAPLSGMSRSDRESPTMAKRVKGIEPSSVAWEATALPLS